MVQPPWKQESRGTQLGTAPVQQALALGSWGFCLPFGLLSSLSACLPCLHALRCARGCRSRRRPL
jgi:hypothetical protein